MTLCAGMTKNKNKANGFISPEVNQNILFSQMNDSPNGFYPGKLLDRIGNVNRIFCDRKLLTTPFIINALIHNIR